MAVMFICFLFVCDNIIYPNINLSVGDVNNEIGTKVNVSEHAHVNDEGSGKVLALTGAIVGVGGLVAKSIAKAPMSPLQKAGAVLVGAVMGGLAQKALNNWNENVGAGGTSSTTSINSTVSEFIDDSQVSLLHNTLFQLEIIYLGCLYLVFLIVIQLMFKLYLKDNVKLSLDKLLGNNLNTRLEYYLNKIVHLNKRMNIFWMWFGVLVIMYIISLLIRLNYLMRIKLDDAINAHLSLHPLKDNLYITDRSIEEMLSYLYIGNYICLVFIFLLMIQIICRFNLEKNVMLNLSLMLGIKCNN